MGSRGQSSPGRKRTWRHWQKLILTGHPTSTTFDRPPSLTCHGNALDVGGCIALQSIPVGGISLIRTKSIRRCTGNWLLIESPWNRRPGGRYPAARRWKTATSSMQLQCVDDLFLSLTEWLLPPADHATNRAEEGCDLLRWLISRQLIIR